jgi:hypothetical protein
VDAALPPVAQLNSARPYRGRLRNSFLKSDAALGTSLDSIGYVVKRMGAHTSERKDVRRWKCVERRETLCGSPGPADEWQGGHRLLHMGGRVG